VSNQQLGVRVFPIYYGISEDPATGSGNGCLAAYLVKHRYFGKTEIDLTVGQGYEIARPSILHLKAKLNAERYHIAVGGRVFPIAEGFWGMGSGE
jgi:trans-2,3-dihydro-3-hydroxyanthranilate isomerase